VERGEKGETGAQGRRGREFSLRQALVYACCFLAIGVSTAGWLQLGSNIKREGRERRSETCRTFEGQHLQEVQQLSKTYDYLAGLTRRQLRDPINRAVLKNLPELEQNARSDQDQHGVFVPLYCDAPGVGLPEPDPKVPDRPAVLR